MKFKTIKNKVKNKLAISAYNKCNSYKSIDKIYDQVLELYISKSLSYISLVNCVINEF